MEQHAFNNGSRSHTDGVEHLLLPLNMRKNFIYNRKFQRILKESSIIAGSRGLEPPPSGPEDSYIQSTKVQIPKHQSSSPRHTTIKGMFVWGFSQLSASESQKLPSSTYRPLESSGKPQLNGKSDKRENKLLMVFTRIFNFLPS